MEQEHERNSHEKRRTNNVNHNDTNRPMRWEGEICYKRAEPGKERKRNTWPERLLNTWDEETEVDIDSYPRDQVREWQNGKITHD